jgi:acetyltransferase (GNAT) family protein
VSSIYSAMRESVASHGWGNGLLHAIGRALRRVTRGRCRLFKYYFVAQPVPEQSEAPARATQTRVYRVFGSEDIIATFPRPPEVIAGRFAGGAACFVAERGAQLVGFIWIKRKRYEEDEVRCDYLLDPAGGVAWDFDSWVAPEFRMTRAFVQLWGAANEYLRQQGCRWSASRISAFNPVSLASHRRLGAIRLSTGVFVVAGSTQLALFSCRPYFHLSLGAGSRPKLLFHSPEQRSRKP